MAAQNSYSNKTPADGDYVTGVDISDTTQSADGSTASFLMSALATYVSGVMRALANTWTAAQRFSQIGIGAAAGDHPLYVTQAGLSPANTYLNEFHQDDDTPYLLGFQNDTYGSLSFYVWVESDGTAHLGSATSSIIELKTGGTRLTLTPNGIVSQASAATNVPLIIDGASGQSADLLELRNNSGTVLTSFDAAADISLPAKTANTVFAGPTTGAAARPTWRALVAADIPSLSSVYQPLDADLTAIAGLTSAANKGIQFTGSGTAATYDLTAAGKALLDDADAAAQRTTLGLGTAATQASSAFAAASHTHAASDITSGTLSAARIVASQALTDQATITWDTSAGAFATVTLGGSRTMAAPTNLTAGASYGIKVTQGSGGQTLTWNSVFKWAGGTAPVLSTAASAVDVLTFISDGTNLYGSILKGFA